MYDYEIRIDYADETTEVTTVVGAASIVEAIEIARRDPDVVGATLLATIDLEPQAYLAGYRS
jgi:hypothetical protein